MFGDVDNSVDVEGDLLGVRGPTLVAEAVVVFAVRLCGEGVVVGGNGLLEVLAVSQGILDLRRPSVSICVLFSISIVPPSQCSSWTSPGRRRTIGFWIRYIIASTTIGAEKDSRATPKTPNIKTGAGIVHTQKSTSRFPLPPNSRSPTWKVTVMTSSRCSDSWKHSRV